MDLGAHNEALEGAYRDMELRQPGDLVASNQRAKIVPREENVLFLHVLRFLSRV
jgi:hypothetical protein